MFSWKLAHKYVHLHTCVNLSEHIQFWRMLVKLPYSKKSLHLEIYVHNYYVKNN